jgi:hypothetical protein
LDTLQASIEAFSLARIVTRNKHNKDKKLHNSEEKLHNSHEPELTWQEKTDLSPEDDIEGGSEIYYFNDEDGNIHSCEFLTKELIPDEGEVKRSPKKEPSGKLQVLKPAAIDIISLARPNEAQQQVTLPARKSGPPS